MCAARPKHRPRGTVRPFASTPWERSKPGTLIASQEVKITRDAYGPVMVLSCWAKGIKSPCIWSAIWRLQRRHAAIIKSVSVSRPFSDQKTRGFHIHKSHIAEAKRLRHRTDMEVEKNYINTHGQSEVGFAFCYLLGFQLLPRLKHLKHQKLYRPGAGEEYHYANLQPINERTWMCYHQALP